MTMDPALYRPCPRCNAAIGEACEEDDGSTLVSNVPPHAERTTRCHGCGGYDTISRECKSPIRQRPAIELMCWVCGAYAKWVSPE